jgi:FkbM family methyltransferase
MTASSPAPINRRKACRHGEMVFNIHDAYIGRSLDLYGEFSEGEAEVFRQVVKPTNIVVEVGANIGPHTVLLAQLTGPQGLVLAFEPQRIVFQALCANLALNSILHVDARQQAVGAKPGELLVPAIDYSQEGNFGGLELGKWQAGERVQVVTLDSLNLARCDLLKIDVEGMEKSVLEGATATLARLRPPIYVENDRPDKSAELIRYLDGLSYAMYWHAPPMFNPGNFFGNATNVFGNVVSLNMLCVHKDIPHNLADFQRVEVPAA